jgi:Flp pilus assembly protein TadG
MILRTTPHRRKAASLVEAAFVLPIALLFIFGLVEYGRLVFLIQTAENAAREGARYAVARTADGTTQTDVQTCVTNAMAGRQSELAGFTIDVQNVDPNTGTVITGSNWNDAPFGGAILVRVSGTYSPILPSFLRLPATVQVRATSMMSSEAN